MKRYMILNKLDTGFKTMADVKKEFSSYDETLYKIVEFSEPEKCIRLIVTATNGAFLYNEDFYTKEEAESKIKSLTELLPFAYITCKFFEISDK